MAHKRTLPVSVKIFIFTLAAIGVVLLAGLLPVSIIRSHHIHNEWSKYADRFIKARALSQSMNSPAAIAKYNDHSLLQVRIYPLGADINELTRDQADKTIIFSDLSMPVSRHVVTQNTGFGQKQIGPWQELPATAPIVNSAVISSGSAALADNRG